MTRLSLTRALPIGAAIGAACTAFTLLCTSPDRSGSGGAVGDIPSPANLGATYDTIHGIVTVHWDRSTFPDLLGYLVYRNDTGSTVPVLISRTGAITDTFFRDTVFRGSSDTTTRVYVYRAKLQDHRDSTSLHYSTPVTVTAVSPARVRTFIALKTLDAIDDSTCMAGDTIRIVAYFHSANRIDTSVTWFWGAQNTVVRHRAISALQGSDTLAMAWSDTGLKTVAIRVVDNAGTVWMDTIRITVLGVPPVTVLQDQFRALKFGMFLCFNMSTFDRCCCEQCYSVSGEWGAGRNGFAGKPACPPQNFRPTTIDCGQWADVAKSAGCKYLVLTTKHHDGFCLWHSALTSYCVTNAACTTDVVRQFVDSARSRGLKVGFYYSMRDYTSGYDTSFIKGQLTELLTRYGDVLCLWFDGWGWDMGYNRVPYATIRNLIKSIQPRCLLIENNREVSLSHSDIVEYEIPVTGNPKVGNTLPSEGNQPIRSDQCWFWHPDKNCDLLSAQTIVDQLHLNNARNANYLLSLTPDTSGRIPQCQADAMKQVGTLLGISP